MLVLTIGVLVVIALAGSAALSRWVVASLALGRPRSSSTAGSAPSDDRRVGRRPVG